MEEFFHSWWLWRKCFKGIMASVRPAVCTVLLWLWAWYCKPTRKVRHWLPPLQSDIQKKQHTLCGWNPEHWHKGLLTPGLAGITEGGISWPAPAGAFYGEQGSWSKRQNGCSPLDCPTWCFCPRECWSPDLTPASWHAPKQRSLQAPHKECTSALVFPSMDVVPDLQGLYLHFFYLVEFLIACQSPLSAAIMRLTTSR